MSSVLWATDDIGILFAEFTQGYADLILVKLVTLNVARLTGLRLEDSWVMVLTLSAHISLTVRHARQERVRSFSASLEASDMSSPDILTMLITVVSKLY